MKLKFFLLINFLALSCDRSESVVVDCEFINDRDWGYGCKVKNSELITSKDDREISEVRGQHQNGKSNDDVKFFYSIAKKVSFFPIITKAFYNVNSVAIVFTKDLKEITREDLKQFNGSLEMLHLYGDGIETIEADLFEDNQNLDVLDLQSNNIRHIADGALTNLNISTFHINNNPCKQFGTIEETEKDCKDPNNLPWTIKQLQYEISALSQNLTETYEENKKLKKEAEENQKIRQESREILRAIEKNFSKIDENSKKMEQKFGSLESRIGDQEACKCDLSVIEAKFERQCLNFESKLNQIPSKLSSIEGKVEACCKKDDP